MNFKTAFTKRPRWPFLLLTVIAATGNIVAQWVHAVDLGVVLIIIQTAGVVGALWPLHKKVSS